MMWYWGNGAHWWGWLIGFVIMVAFWGMVVWAVWYAVTSFTRSRGQSTPPRESTPPRDAGPPREAKQILDERLARGEIDAEEYRRLRELIERDGGHGGNQPTPVGTGQRP